MLAFARGTYFDSAARWNQVRSEPSTGTLSIVNGPRTVSSVPTQTTRSSTVHSVTTTMPGDEADQCRQQQDPPPLLTPSICARVLVRSSLVGL